MPYCQVKTCEPEIAKRAEYTPEFNEVHQKHGVRCPAGHHSWPPSHTAPTGHPPHADTAWQDVPVDWLLSHVRDFDPENKIARRCRAEWLRRWEAKSGHTYGGGSIPRPRPPRPRWLGGDLSNIEAFQSFLPAVAAIAPELAPILITPAAVDISGAWATVTPRDWQRAALPLALAAIAAGKRAIVSATMGSGKSILLSEIARCTPEVENSIIVITAPTVRLVDQLAATVAQICGVAVGKYYTHAKQIAPITVCCNASAGALADELAARKLSVSLWIADETHRTESAQILDAYAALAPAAAIGFTATPYRSKKGESLSLWTDLAYEYSVADALRDGVVVPPSLVSWTGDAVTIDTACIEMVKNIRRHGPGIVNATTIADAEGFAAILNRNGVLADVIHSGMSRVDQAAAVESLRSGEIETLVHINMLSEGVDFPWLRWLCMRRPVGSRVRFCQEVGRVLRASPGKDCAYLLDPHDLFNSFGLTYEAVLNGGAKEQSALPEEDEDAQLVLDLPKDAPLAQKLSQFRSYIRRLYLSFTMHGVIQPNAKITSTSWRYDQPSEKQTAIVATISKLNTSPDVIPLLHRKTLARIGDEYAGLKKGDISDLFSICFALADRRRQKLPWPNLGADADAIDQ